MPHIELDVNFLTHPKVLQVEPLAQLLHIRAILYCCQHLTDGWLPLEAVAYITLDYTDEQGFNFRPDELIKQLVEVNLWHENGGGGYEIHDFLEYQLSREQVAIFRENKRKAGQAGGKASASSRRLAGASRRSTVAAEAELNPAPSSAPTPISSPSLNSSSLLKTPEAKGTKQARGLVEWPEGYAYNQKHEAMAAALGVHVKNEFVKFHDNALKKGLKWKDWDAAFRTWLRNAPKFNEGRTR